MNFKKKILAITLVILTSSSVYATPPLLPQKGFETFYYEIGGGTDFRVTGGVELPAEIQMARDFGLLLSDGSFNPLDSVKKTLEGVLSGILDALTSNVKGLINLDSFTASLGLLPGNIFCQANPTACQIQENYTVRAEEKEQFNRQFYEKIEAKLSESRGVLDGWVLAGKGNNLVKAMNDAKASGENDLEIIVGKIRKYTGESGLKWIGGQMAGGNNQPPIRPIADAAKAGFNLLLGRSSLDSTKATGTDPLLDYWDTPEEAGKWITEVVGEFRPDINNVHVQQSWGGDLSGSDDGDLGTGAEDVTVTQSFVNSDMSTPALGLSPKVRKESQAIQSKIKALTSSPTSATNEELTQIMGGSTGVVITQRIVDILKNSPLEDTLIKQISDDAARANVIRLALESRRILLAGRNENHISSYEVATKDIDIRADRIKEYIDDLMYERRIRGELLSGTLDKIFSQDVNQTESNSIVDQTRNRERLGNGGIRE